MVTKGIIKAVPQPGDNHYQVRVPILEDNTGQEVVMRALLCIQPGLTGGYAVGDCVFVSFEGDSHMDDSPVGEVPVILGKLYTLDMISRHINLSVEEITVSSTATLPKNVKISDFGANDISILMQGVAYLTDRVNTLEEKLEALTSKEGA